jgi:hypothetical protein
MYATSSFMLISLSSTRRIRIPVGWITDVSIDALRSTWMGGGWDSG